MKSKKQLAIALSKLDVFSEADPSKEQYATDSEVAASILWDAFMQGDIENKVIADLGCGTGILGIGCLLLGAKKVYFVDVDSKVLEILKKNLEAVEFEGEYKILNIDVSSFDEEVDVVVENPPFGVQREHADKVFLQKAFDIADIVYTLHKPESKDFIEAISGDNGFRVASYIEYEMPLKAAMKHHTRKIYRIKVGCWRLISP